jgi:hypothetical protein
VLRSVSRCRSGTTVYFQKVTTEVEMRFQLQRGQPRADKRSDRLPRLQDGQEDADWASSAADRDIRARLSDDRSARSGFMRVTPHSAARYRERDSYVQ